MPSGTRSLSARALTNIQLAELFARNADSQQDQRQRALRRASRRALMWPEEAWRLRQTGRPLTELAGVGPWIASKLEEWMVDPPEVPEPPPLRSGFRSYAECRDIVGADPVWRKAVRADLQMHTSETDGALPLGGWSMPRVSSATSSSPSPTTQRALRSRTAWTRCAWPARVRRSLR